MTGAASGRAFARLTFSMFCRDGMGGSFENSDLVLALVLVQCYPAVSCGASQFKW